MDERTPLPTTLNLCFSHFSSLSQVVISRSSHKTTIHSHTQVKWMHHLHRRTLSLSDSYHFKAFLGTHPGRFRKPCSGWRALAPSSPRTGREDDRRTRQSTVGEELDCGSRGELPPFSYADRVFITCSSAMMASRSTSFPTPPKRQAYIYTALTSALRTSRLSRLLL